MGVVANLRGPAGAPGTSNVPWLNVRDFGAKGDGTTDDSAAIQAAINAAVHPTFPGIGGTVFFPYGKYYIATGLTNSLAGTTFIGQGSPGASSDLASGDTQVIVGDNIWGLTLGTSTGEYRGYHMENLEWQEKNAGQAHGGVRLNYSSLGDFTNCAFGKFSKSVESTVGAGANGQTLSALSTLPLASTTGWPTSGAGYVVTVPGSTGQIYHSFWYTGVSGNSLTGVTYGGPTTDTVVTGAQVAAAVGVCFLVNGIAASGESSMNSFIRCNFGTSQYGFMQLGIAMSLFSNCFLDGGHNRVDLVPPSGSTGLMIVSGTIDTSGCLVQSYDVLAHIGKGNQSQRLEFRYEGWKTAGVIMEADAGTSSAVITGKAGGSNLSSHGAAIILKTGVKNCVIDCTPILGGGSSVTMPVTDNGTGTRYTQRFGAPSAATTLGSVVSRQPVYDGVGALIGYMPIYKTIT